MLISVVIPVLNEAESVTLLLLRLRTALAGYRWEALFVDDGSTDATVAVLEEEALLDSRVRLLRFSRNFGHQAAVTAGLDFANGDAVVIMDADLQDPPELLPRMIALFEHGFDVVSPRRVSRTVDSRAKRWTAALFYRVLSVLADHPVTPEVGDFRLFSRRAVDAIRSLREQHRYMRGLVSWLGLSEAFVPYERERRAAGETKYPPLKMLRFAWTAVSSFSAVPLRLSIALGATLSFAGFGYLLWVMWLAMFTHSLVPGWASLAAMQCAFSGVILLALGGIGDYLARTYEEAKRRPLYVVAETCNIAVSARLPERAVVLAPARAATPSFALDDTFLGPLAEMDHQPVAPARVIPVP